MCLLTRLAKETRARRYDVERLSTLREVALRRHGEEPVRAVHVVRAQLQRRRHLLDLALPTHVAAAKRSQTSAIIIVILCHA